jgi:uncharacterized membrane protein
MDLALFSGAGYELVLRWLHYMAGVAWIGILYYFNFVQVPFFAETEAPVRTGAIVKLVPRALWWFRWAAMLTFLSGFLMLMRFAMDPSAKGGPAWFGTIQGAAISIGALLGTIMFLNVWLVIWPNQKVVIASTTAVASGGQADPRAAGAGARAFVASRTNAVLSLPMLFFMASSSHLPMTMEPGKSIGMPMGIITLIIVALEINALVGKKGEAFNKLLEKIPGVIHLGLVLALVMYLLLDGLL